MQGQISFPLDPVVKFQMASIKELLTKNVNTKQGMVMKYS
jgi:hypothetical protein